MRGRLILLKNETLRIISIHTAGITIPVMARPLPFNRPELCLIFIKATIPRIIAGVPTEKASTFIRKNAGILKIPKYKAARASPLVLVSGSFGLFEVSVKSRPHELHDLASTEFSVPYFGQYIVKFL